MDGTFKVWELESVSGIECACHLVCWHGHHHCEQRGCLGLLIVIPTLTIVISALEGAQGVGGGQHAFSVLWGKHSLISNSRFHCASQSKLLKKSQGHREHPEHRLGKLLVKCQGIQICLDLNTANLGEKIKGENPTNYMFSLSWFFFIDFYV